MNRKNTKQILAILGILILLAMYGSTLVFAVQKNENAQAWFRASIACTIIVPVFLYAFLLVAKVVKPQKSAVIDSIVFDVGRVLLDFPWEHYAEQLSFSPEAIQFLNDKVLYSPLWGQFDLNNRSEQDIIDEFVKLGPQYEKEIRELVGTIDRCISPFPYTDGWLASLKAKGYRLYLLSNWSEPTYHRLKDRGIMDFTKYMDGCVWSFEHHAAKPDRKIFDLLVSRYGVDPARTVFLDDNMNNTSAAEQYGYHAILFTDYADAVERLKAFGVQV